MTGEAISFVGSPSGFRDLEPADAVMSTLTPGGGRRTDRARRGRDPGLSHWIFFFVSEEAAREWTSERPGTATFPIEEGYELGRRWMAHKWGVASNA